MTTILASLKSTLDAELQKLDKRRARVLKVLESLNSLGAESQLSFRVDLDSLWSDHGEKNTTTRGRGSLEKVLARAIRQFKKANNRSDVQATCNVYVMPPGIRKGIRVDKAQWRKCFDELKNQ